MTVPVIATDDIPGSIDYYSKVLGFSPDFTVGEPVVYAGVKSADVELYFTHDPKYATLLREHGIHPDVFIWVNDLDAIFNMHVRNGAKVIQPIAERAWGTRQYVIEDINGYHLKIAQPIDQ